MEEKKGAPVKAVSLMMLITLAGKVLGLIRDRLLTINYGTGMEANAFLTASRIPRVFFDALFASAITASFIPIFNEYLVKRDKKDAYSLAGTFLAVMLAASALLTLLGIAFSGQLTYFFADGYDPETAALAARLTRIMFPTVVFTAAAYSFVGVLQSFDEFNLPALISVVSNVVVIGYYLLFNRRFGINGLAVAFLIAWLMQALIQIPWLMRKKVRLTLSKSEGTSEGLKKIFRLMLPVMVSTWVLPINQTISSKFGSRLFEGAGVSAVELSYNLYTIIVGVFVLSVTNFIFPRMARSAAGNDNSSLKETTRLSIHASMYFVLPMTAGLMALAGPIVSLIYGGGRFDEFSVSITSRSLVLLSLGMTGYALQAVISRVYFAEQKGLPPLIAGGVSIILNALLCALLSGKIDVAGIAIASAVASTVNGVLLALPLKRRGLDFFDRAFFIDMLKMALSAAATGFAAYLVYRFLGAGKLISCIVPAIVGAAVYFAMTTALKIPEARFALGFLSRKDKNA